VKITKALAQKLALAGQGLDGPWELPGGKEGVAQTIERLGYVQIDTISVVQRAHHHTLWSRRGDYHPRMLDELLAADRRVFEYWTHAASYVPMCDYRYYVRSMNRFADRPRTREFLERHAKAVDEVRARIRRDGPAASADFAAPDARKQGTWWDWKPAKRALETLFSLGELMVTERRSFQRVYDLAERVLPADVDTTAPPADDVMRWRIGRLLARQGVSNLRHWSLRDREAVRRAVAELIDADEAVELAVPGLDGGPWYALTEAVEAASRRRRRKRLHVLSPFDGLVIWRGRLRELFGFDYKLECYLPAAKRKYGYFCLPILWGRQFIGRLDAKAERRARRLIVRRLTFEPGFDGFDAAAGALAAKLSDFAAFNGCERIAVEQVRPGKLTAPLVRALTAKGAP